MIGDLTENDPDDGVHVVPGAIRRALGRAPAAVQRAVLSYLVPDASLLPPESIRFFYLDRNWTDALVDGVLSIGTFTTADRAQLEALRQVIRDEVDEAERAIRQPRRRGTAVRSGRRRQRIPAAVASSCPGWPGLHVRAYRVDRQADDAILPESDPDRLKVLRMERLAPAVLLVLFDGVPAVVHVEEPRQGIQFGALRPDAEPLSTARDVPLRDASTGADLPNQSNRCRSGATAPGSSTCASCATASPRCRRRTSAATPGLSVDANEFALEMLRFPYRQVFGDPANEPGEPLVDVFRPTVAFTLQRRATGTSSSASRR